MQAVFYFVSALVGLEHWIWKWNFFCVCVCVSACVSLHHYCVYRCWRLAPSVLRVCAVRSTPLLASVMWHAKLSSTASLSSSTSLSKTSLQRWVPVGCLYCSVSLSCGLSVLHSSCDSWNFLQVITVMFGLQSDAFFLKFVTYVIKNGALYLWIKYGMHSFSKNNNYF